MKSLFLKIFLSYWLATALFLVLAIFTTLALRPQREFSNFEALQPRILDQAVQAYQKGGTPALRDYLRQVRDAEHVRAFLYDEHNQELTGRNLPEWVGRVARGEVRTADSIWGRLRPIQFLRQSLTTADGQRYTLVMELPPGQPALFGPHGVPGLGIAIAIISSGLVCYFLARFLTAPVVRLREATQKLAAGDLTARAGTQRDTGRHDEMAELVRDFDGMAERIEKLVKAQSRLLNAISHELRSPLARLNVALALARQRAGPEAQNSLDRVERESDRLNELIERLLTIARLESGDDALQKFPIDLGELVAEIAKDADFEAQGRNCRVEVISTVDCLVNGDPSLLHSAIENVVRNATRYTREGTSVQIRLDRIQTPAVHEAVVQITDSGPGVPEDALGKMFRPFYRIDDARVRRTGGVGLGLAITQRSVRLHGGTVTASNRPEGGLQVEIRLPLAVRETAELAESKTVPALGSPT